MNYCINQPLEKYNVEIEDMKLGIYNSYKERPALLAAVLLLTTAAFEYEEGSLIEPGNRIGSINADMEGYLADTLITNVGGKLVLALLEMLNPYQFLEFIKGFDLSHLPIRRFYQSDDDLRLVIMARVSVWFHAQDVLPSMSLTQLKELKNAETKVRGIVNGRRK